MDKASLLKKLQTQTILFDGAMGSALAQKGLLAGDCPEEWNRTYPKVVAEIHRAYVEAGAQVVTTNSLGANRIELERYGLGKQVMDLNRSAARIARDNSPTEVFVAGTVGPTGILTMPMNRLTFDDLVAVFREQIAGLVEGGVDVILVESMSQLHEARAAVTATQEFRRVPVMVTMAFTAGHLGFRTTMGVDPQSAVLELAAAGADAIGCSCGQLTPKQMARLVGELRTLTKLPLIAIPDAGKPKLTRGKTVYSRTPQQLAEGVFEILQAGANIIGGGWGTTPDHIAAICALIRSKKEKISP